MKRVFCVKTDKFDISAASEYGTLHILDISSSPLSPNECIEEIKHGLNSFNPSTDYILMSGSTLLLTYLLLSALLKFKSVNILVFHSVSRKYICRKAGCNE